MTHARNDYHPGPLGPVNFLQFHHAYLAVLNSVTANTEFRNAPRDNPSHECLNVSFTITNPAGRQPALPTRRTNPVFNLAEALWFVAGRDDLDMITYYAPKMRAYSANGTTIDGSAYGTRLFQHNPDLDGQSAFHSTLNLIRSDLDTKRAVLPIFGPQEVGQRDHPDISCTIALQLLHRAGQLHAICYMRANDAWSGLVSDVYSATFIQELAATILSLDLGGYTHHVGSMHLADHNIPRARAILAEAASGSPHLVLARPERMPSSTSLDTLAEVCRHEELLRHNEIHHSPTTLAKLDLHPYWQRRIALLEAYRQIKHRPADHSIDTDLLSFLHPLDAWLLDHRWPTRVPVSTTAIGYVTGGMQRAESAR